MEYPYHLWGPWASQKGIPAFMVLAEHPLLEGNPPVFMNRYALVFQILSVGPGGGWGLMLSPMALTYDGLPLFV